MGGAGGGVRELHVVLAGSTAHAEQRLLFDTNYFAELGLCYAGLRALHLHFVGPEAASEAALRKAHAAGQATQRKEQQKEQQKEQKKKMNRNNNNNKKKKKKKKNRGGPAAAPRVTPHTTVEHFKGTSTDFFRKHRPELLPGGGGGSPAPPGDAITVVVGFNPGFGSGNAPLVASWTKDLLFLARHNVPVIFTQANDYSDLRGELMVMQGVVGAKFILPPLRNPFPMATTAHEPGRRETWSCGNSFMYAWQGFASDEMARRAAIFEREPSTLARRLAQVVSLQQAADRAGGSPPSAAGGAGSVMAQIRITVDEVGQVDLSGYLAEAPAREQEVVMKKTKKEEAEEKEKEAENTKPKKDKKDEEDAEKMKQKNAKAEKDKQAKRANHLAFMEDLGKTAVARGYMPPMDMVDAYKTSNAATNAPAAPAAAQAAAAVAAVAAVAAATPPPSTPPAGPPSAPSTSNSVADVPSDRSAALRKRGLDLALELD